MWARKRARPGRATYGLGHTAPSGEQWAFEILLAEFTVLREEIVSVKTQLERTYAYLFALIGAIVAAKLIDEGATTFLHEHIWIVPLTALLAMWFPINHQLMSTDMILAATYIRDVLAPKLNFLAYRNVRRITSNDDQIDEMLGWSRKMRGDLSDNIYAEMSRRPMSWEQFMAHMRLRQSPRRFVFGPLYVARGLILYVPTLALTVFYVGLQTEGANGVRKTEHLGHNLVRHTIVNYHVSEPGIFLAVIVVLLFIWSVRAQAATTAMIEQGTRPDPHTEIPAHRELEGA
jgi:hypothetical protein